MDLLVDAGVGDAQRAVELARTKPAGRPLDGIVVGLESVTDIRQLHSIVEALGPDRAIFSLDMKMGRLLTSVDALLDVSPIALGDTIWQAGFRRLIVLDLARVGSAQGPATVETCRRLAARHSWRQLISGGGVRGVTDVEALGSAGCHGVLIASALHNGTLQHDDIDRCWR
jgi:phosphoribosylformimino-5-aminoimidazole carboxamide ribotide isomerase